jgi:hypothetical protein
MASLLCDIRYEQTKEETQYPQLNIGAIAKGKSASCGRVDDVEGAKAMSCGGGGLNTKAAASGLKDIVQSISMLLRTAVSALGASKA